MNIQTKANPYQEQIMRLSSLQKFPLYPQGIAELRDALKKNCGTPDRAAMVIDRIVDEREVCPTPRELAAMGIEIIRKLESAPLGCEICNGQPWVTIERIVTDRFTGERDEDGRPLVSTMTRQGSKRCDCPKGQWFQSKDRENQGKREMGLPV